MVDSEGDAGDRGGGRYASECDNDDEDVDGGKTKEPRRWKRRSGNDHDSAVEDCCADSSISGSHSAGSDESRGICASVDDGGSDEDHVGGGVDIR